MIHSPAPIPQSAPGTVFWAEFNPGEKEPLLDGFIDIEDVINEIEVTPAGRERMAAARRHVAAQYYADEGSGLSAFRLAKGWSQKQLAEQIGTSQSHVARIESGHTDPQLSTIERLCEVLGISIEQFRQAFRAKRKSA